MTDGDPIKRLHYFDHQFLREKDFNDEQAYHLRMRRLHNRSMHTWGVVTGLDLEFAAGASLVTITAGSALDSAGREIVLRADQPSEDLAARAGKTVFITIAYNETQSDETTEGGAEGNTRWTETPQVFVREVAPGGQGLELVLGQVKVGDDGKIASADPTGRRAAGVNAGDLEARSLVLSSPNIASNQWPSLRATAPSQADLTGTLRISGNLTIGGTLTGGLPANSVGTTQLANNAVATAKIADNAVATAKIADNAITAAKIADGSVATAELANAAVTIQKMKTRILFDGTLTIPAAASNSVQLLSVRLSPDVRGLHVMVFAVSPTVGARFEWSNSYSTINDGGGNTIVVQSVLFTSRSNIPIEVRARIYDLAEV